MAVWLVMALGSLIASSATYAANVTTDAPVYQPGEMVIIEGSDFIADETVHLIVTYSDGTPLPFDVVSEWNVVADGGDSPPASGGTSADGGLLEGLDGFLTDWYLMESVTGGGELLLTASGTTSGYTATALILTAAGSLHQLQNDATPEWANGNINKNNSCYAEGNAIPYRYFLESLTAGSTHYFTIEFEATKGGTHAIDYLAQYDLSEADVIASMLDEECSDISQPADPNCTPPIAQVALPDPTLASSYTSALPAELAGILSPTFPIDGPGSLYGYNVTNVSVSQYSYGGSVSDRTLSLVVSFEVAPEATSVGFFWGGHMSEGHPDGWGLGNGAASVTGAPYHMRAGAFDGGGGAWSDRSVNDGVICLPPDITLTCSSGPYCTGGTFTCSVPSGAVTYSWTLDGATILTGQGTETITYEVTAAPGATVTVSVGACNSNLACGDTECCTEASYQFTAVDCCTVTIDCPPDVTLECDQSTDPANTGTADALASGTCPLPITVSHTDTETAGDCPQEKTISRLWKATDGNGTVRAQCTQTITVQDTQAPSITCPGPITVECPSDVSEHGAGDGLRQLHDQSCGGVCR
jgi:hypothetical protein